MANKALFIIIPIVIAIGIGVALFSLSNETTMTDKTSTVTCSSDQIIIQDKSNNKTCTDIQTALQKMSDGSATIADTTDKASKLLIKLALSSADSSKLSQQEIFNIATLAYVYGYSPHDSWQTREQMTHNSTTGDWKINVITNYEKLLGPEYTAVPSVNRDTLYTPTWIDLTDEPLVLHVPDEDGRYYTFQFMDFYTNNVAYLGKGITGTDENNFVIVGPDWKGDIPSDLKRVDVTTNSLIMTGRTLVHGEDDVPAVNAIQEQYALTPLSLWKDGTTAAPKSYTYTPYDDSDGFAFFKIVNLALTKYPPPAEEQKFVDLFAKINVGPNQTFDENSLDDTTKKTIQNALDVGDKFVSYYSEHVGPMIDGWSTTHPETGAYGENYALRAGTSMSLWGLNSPDKAMYPKAHVDGNGDDLDGKNKYVLHFDVDKFPPVDAFWSMTMYESSGTMYENDMKRYNIGSITAGLTNGTDGSLDILIQHEKPDDTSNWLPSPEDDFYVVLRLYMPQKSAIDGTWTVPGIQKAS